MQYKGYEIQRRKEDNSYIIRDEHGEIIVVVENLLEAWEQIDLLTEEESPGDNFKGAKNKNKNF